MERRGTQQQSTGRLTFWGLKIILYFLLLPDILSALTISADKNRAGSAHPPRQHNSSRLTRCRDPPTSHRTQIPQAGRKTPAQGPSAKAAELPKALPKPAGRRQRRAARDAPHEAAAPEPQRGAEASAGDGQLTSDVPHRLDPRPDEEAEPAITERRRGLRGPSARPCLPRRLPLAALPGDPSRP